MKVDTALRKSLLKYPTIERNKLDVYIQMFITTGGGYDWVNGSLCTPSESTINTKEQAIKYLIDDTLEKLSSNGDRLLLLNNRFKSSEIIKKDKDGNKLNPEKLEKISKDIFNSINKTNLYNLHYTIQMTYDLENRMKDLSIPIPEKYPITNIFYGFLSSNLSLKISKKDLTKEYIDNHYIINYCKDNIYFSDYSNILRIPNNIKSDWKAAIMEFYDWIIQHQSYFDQDNWNEYKYKLEKSVNKIR